MTYLEGNILHPPVPAIVHQCNCVTRGQAGLAKQIFKKFPYSNTYAGNTPRVPGMVSCHKSTWCRVDLEHPLVFNLYAQNQPGACRAGMDETPEIRLEWMRTALEEMGKIIVTEAIFEVCIPFLLGCGLAGGVWEDYKKVLLDFEERSTIKLICIYLPMFANQI